MNKQLIKDIAELRMVVEFLGEKDQFGWWPCLFFSSSSDQYLSPIFPKTTMIARYQGVKQAAQKLHDISVGKGSVYHLFRLPENIEDMVLELLKDEEYIDGSIEPLLNKEAALSKIENMATNKEKGKEGPTLLGDFNVDKLDEVIGKMANNYLEAFKKNIKSYPYLRAN